MLLNEEKNRLRVGGESLDTTNFKIKASGKAFKALIDGLYSNKIGSIVRELISNQWDAHKQAGCEDKPFKVVAPTLLDPSVTFQDYGIGMSHEFVMSLYSTLFDSTKDQDNDMIGAFGLGSKSPFSYTDSFSLVTIKDGYKNVYQVYLDRTGVPMVRHVDTINTDEHPGTTVKIPCEVGDIQLWTDEIINFIKFLDPLPEHNLGDFNSLDVLYSNNNWAIVNNSVKNSYSSWRYNNKIWIQQGIVNYELDSNQVNLNLNFGIGKDLIIKVPIGSVEVTVSREGLSYTPETVKFLSDYLEEIREDIKKYINSRLHEATNPYEWYKACCSAKDILTSSNLCVDNFKFNGEEYKFKTILNIINGHPGPDLWTKWDNDFKGPDMYRFDKFNVPFKKNYRLELLKSSNGISHYTKLKTETYQGRADFEDVIFLVKDEHRWKAKLWSNKDHLNLDNKQVVFITKRPGQEDIDDAVKAFKKDFEGFKVRYLSKLPNEISTQSNSNRVYKSTPLYTIGTGYFNECTDTAMNSLLTDKSSKKYYVRINRFVADIDGMSMDKKNLHEFNETLFSILNIPDSTVYAVPKSNWDVIDQFDSTWVDISDLYCRNKDKFKKVLHKDYIRYKVGKHIRNSLGILDKNAEYTFLKTLIDINMEDLLSEESIKFIKFCREYPAFLYVHGEDYPWDTSNQSSNYTTSLIHKSISKKITKVIEEDVKKIIDNSYILKLGLAWKKSKESYRSYYSHRGFKSDEDKEFLMLLAKGYHEGK